MKISVVIPAYNEEKLIGKCLESLTIQEIKADEIIVVDNNCTDKTAEIARKFPVKIVKEEKKGLINARNRGYDEAQFELIARLDADAVPDKKWIKNIRNHFDSKNQIDALFGPLAMYDLPFKTVFFSKVFYAFCKLVLGHNILIGPNTALKRDIWNKVKKYTCKNDIQIHEDIDLSIHINKIGGKIHYDPNFINYVSGRRIKNNPSSFFIEYPIRLVKTFLSHKQTNGSTDI